MPWAGQTWLELIQEGTAGANYGTFNTDPAAGTTLYPQLYGANSFTVRKVPRRQTIRTADAGNRRRTVVANRYEYKGTLKTVLCPDEAAFWVAAVTLTNDAGARPWLPSYSALYWDSTQAWKLLGGMIESLSIESSAEQDYVTLATNWIFQSRDATYTTFAQPAESVYSTLVPYAHVETASNCKIGGTTALTKYKSVKVDLKHTLVGTFDESPNISALYYCGRDLDFSFGPQYVDATLRGDFEAQTALEFTLAWKRSTTYSLSFDCKSTNYIATVDDDLPLDGAGYQNINVEVFFDKTASTDFALTSTAP